MSEREADLRCPFDEERPCLDGCELRPFVLRMLAIYHHLAPPDEVRKSIVTCPSRRGDGERAI